MALLSSNVLQYQKMLLPEKCEHVVAFLLFSYKRICTVAFGICRSLYSSALLILGVPSKSILGVSSQMDKH